MLNCSLMQSEILVEEGESEFEIILFKGFFGRHLRREGKVGNIEVVEHFKLVRNSLVCPLSLLAVVCTRDYTMVHGTQTPCTPRDLSTLPVN